MTCPLLHPGFLLGLGMFHAVAAQPVVTQVSGSLVHGATVSLVGSGFGAKASGQAAPVKFDDFEDGTVGASVVSRGWWQAEAPLENKTYDTTLAPRSRFSSKQIRWHSYGWGAVEGAKGGVFGKGGLGFEATQKAFLNLWAYVDYVDGIPESGPGGSSQLKWIALLTDGPQSWGDPSFFRHESSPSVRLYLWTQDFMHTSNFFLYSTAGYLNPVGGSPELAPAEHHWLNVSLLYKESSGYGVADGGTLVYVSRTPATDGAYFRAAKRNVATRSVGDNGPIHSVALGYFITNGFHEANTYWDDIYIDNSWARVELGDAPVYDDCRHREIQPCSTWTGSSIQFRLNQGSFGKEPVYLFVVDEDNNPSAGFPISLGATAIKARDPKGRRSKSGSVYTLGGRVVSGRSRAAATLVEEGGAKVRSAVSSSPEK